MDGSQTRSVASSQTRAHSRSSTATRLTTQTNSTGSSQRPASPKLTASQAISYLQRLQQAGCGNAPSPLASQSPHGHDADTPAQTPVSSFLHEMLRQERRAEADKAASKPPMDMMNTMDTTSMGVNLGTNLGTSLGTNMNMGASLDLRDVTASPPPRTDSPAEGRKSRSSGGEPSHKKKSMGLKEMEQAMSTMHKQNFDLKLELFHRREKQLALQEKIEQLMSENEKLASRNKRLEEENKGLAHDKTAYRDAEDLLMKEVGKRDRAVQEAARMIILLEGRQESYIKELSILRELAAEFLSSTPPSVPETDNNNDDDRAVSRMPSFMSQPSRSTENLRQVYLGFPPNTPTPRPGWSAAQRPRLDSDGLAILSSEPDYLPGQHFASPSLSDLSESSFQSIYGQRRDSGDLESNDDSHDGLDEQSEDDRPMLLLLQDAAAPQPVTARKVSGPVEVQVSARPRPRIITPTTLLGPSRSANGVPLAAAEAAPQERSQGAQFGTINDTIGPDGQAASVESSRSSSSGRSKEHRREALRRMLGGPDLAQDEMLPPTPDTISTSTLRRYKNSDDRLDGHHQHDDGGHADNNDGGVNLTAELRAMRAAAAAPEDDGMSMLVSSAYFGGQIPMPPRPRSASETTVSQKRGSWGVVNEDDSDTHSLESSLDIWLREGWKSGSAAPNDAPRRTAGQDLDSQKRAHERTPRSASQRHSTFIEPSPGPAMFGFPVHPPAEWDTAAMFGGGGGGGGASLDLADDMFPVQAALFATTGPAPPPPDRRSSLLAHTAPTMVSALGIATPRAAAGKQRKPWTSRYSGGSDFGTPSTTRHSPHPIRESAYAPPPESRKPYPPVSGSGKARGINFFRRSLGASLSLSDVVPTASSSQHLSPASATDTVGSAAPAPSNKSIGVPGWVRRSSSHEDDGATPPPIMRHRAPSGSSRAPPPLDLLDAIPPRETGARTPPRETGSRTPGQRNSAFRPPETPRSGLNLTVPGRASDADPPPMASPNRDRDAPTPSSSRRKWLPFVRSNSMRSRAG